MEDLEEKKLKQEYEVLSREERKEQLRAEVERLKKKYGDILPKTGADVARLFFEAKGIKVTDVRQVRQKKNG